jgi:hypothetical protein
MITFLERLVSFIMYYLSHSNIYCDGAEWNGGALTLISQFMGRLARVNRAPKSTDTQQTANFAPI